MRTKKIAMMVAMAAVVLVALVGSGPALAQTIGGVIQCTTNSCYATGAHQVLFEQVGDGVADNMYALAGHDNLRAQNYTNDNDVANGGPGHDLLHVNDGDALDDARGGTGYDTCVVDAAVEATNSCEMVVYR